MLSHNKINIQSVLDDYKNANLNEKQIAICDYAIKLTLTPSEMTIKDVELLRSKDFDDRAIHDICLITSYFNFINRMADGLGVELEEIYKSK